MYPPRQIGVPALATRGGLSVWPSYRDLPTTLLRGSEGGRPTLGRELFMYVAIALRTKSRPRVEEVDKIQNMCR